MSGIVGVAAGRHGRFSKFSECLANLTLPEGWYVKFGIGYDTAANRTLIVREALDNEREYVMFIDDDMVFEDDHLVKMLAKAMAHDIKILASLYFNRTPPYYAMAFGEHGFHEDGEPYWVPVSLDGAPDEGVAPILAAGTGGMLIHRDVFLAMEDGSWFDHHRVSEDLAFCAKAVEAGFDLFLDLEACMGPFSDHEVWPEFGNGWHVGLKLSEKEMARFKLAP